MTFQGGVSQYAQKQHKTENFGGKIGNFWKKSEIFRKNRKFSEKIGNFRKNRKNLEKIRDFSSRASRADQGGSRGGYAPPPKISYTPLKFFQRGVRKKIFLGGGTSQNFFLGGGGYPRQKESQGSPLWIFWKFFQNFKIYSNNRKIPRVPPLDILEKFSKFQKKFQ